MATQQLIHTTPAGGRLTEYSLDEAWNSHWLIGQLRQAVRPLAEKRIAESDIPFDPQDLEHQALFYLTTLSPSEITSAAIEQAVDDQARLIESRLRGSVDPRTLEWLFRGLSGTRRDLNVANRLKLKKTPDGLAAVGPDGYSLRVDFRKMTDPKIIELYTEKLHYIHQGRAGGDAFGFFFEGDDYPWAVETAEPSLASRRYKREALELHGFNPDRAVELTRLYTLPGSPMNAISLLDGLVSRHYRQAGIEAMFTRTMPAYSKSKSTTTAGGMNQVLCLKRLEHYFAPTDVDGRVVWQQVTKRYLEANPAVAYRVTNPEFRLLPAVDVFLNLQKREASSRISAGQAIIYGDLNYPDDKTYARNSTNPDRHQEPSQARENLRDRIRHSFASLRGLAARA